MADDWTSWRELRRQRPLNEERVARHERLIEIQQQLYARRDRHALREDQIDLDAEGQTELQEVDDLRLSTLLRWIIALGGELEVRAIFPEETITLLREGAAKLGDDRDRGP